MSVNRGFEKMLGFSAKEVIGKTLSDLKIWVTSEAGKGSSFTFSLTAL